MIEGGRREFDLAILRQPAVQRDDLREDFPLLVEEPVLLVFRPALSFLAERLEGRIAFEQQFMKPGEIAPDLEVAEILLRVAIADGCRGFAPEAAFEIEFEVALVRTDHAVHVGHEEMVQQVMGIDFGQPINRHAGDVQMSVAEAIDVALDLDEQTGDQIDRAAELRHFGDVQGHADVVLGAMQPDPGHQRFTGDVIRVVRLVLMPEQGQGNRLHQGDRRQ